MLALRALMFSRCAFWLPPAQVHRNAKVSSRGWLRIPLMRSCRERAWSCNLPAGKPRPTTRGQFSFTDVPPGTYTLVISFVGMAPYSKEITVTGGQATHVEPEMQVASQSESVTVTGEQAHADAEAINRERTAENILQVMPAEIITSLPNANVADAIGRLPGVSLERDEGEGKYVQIRGTQPYYNNVTIDGVNVPAPESGVRQIKLDTIGSDLVESVEVNKTLLANMDADGIGGSVNIRTKTAGDHAHDFVVRLGRVHAHSERARNGPVRWHRQQALRERQTAGRHLRRIVRLERPRHR